MRFKSILAVAIAAASLSAGPTLANVIYDNGGPDNGGYFYADSSYAITISAETFTLGAGANTIAGVNWWGACSDGSFFAASCPAGDFTVSFYNDNSGLPGTLITSIAAGDANQTATGNLVGGATEYSYSATIPDLTLTAGTTYWLGLSDSTSTDFIWGWETTSAAGDNSHALLFPPSLWVPNPADLAFNLTGPATSSVPEPGTLALFGAGLAGFGAMRRRSRARA